MAVLAGVIGVAVEAETFRGKVREWAEVEDQGPVRAWWVIDRMQMVEFTLYSAL